eukprot:gene53875-30385_t
MCTAIPGAAARQGIVDPQWSKPVPHAWGGEADPTADARAYGPAQARKEAHPPPVL